MKYVYVCEERAMAPGIVKDWPLVIPHPETKNGRLVRVRVNDLEERKLTEKLEVQRGIRQRQRERAKPVSATNSNPPSMGGKRK